MIVLKGTNKKFNVQNKEKSENLHATWLQTGIFLGL